MSRRPIGIALTASAALLAALVTAAPASGAGADELAQARAATAQFHRVDVAEAAGYGLPSAGDPLHECIDVDLDLDDDDGAPAMGYHYINGGLLTAELDASAPQALVYAPTPEGGKRLVALEYVVFEETWEASGASEPPSLFGEDFGYTPAPNRYGIPAFYALHAWVWRHNPDGMFAGMNPAVSCADAPG